MITDAYNNLIKKMINRPIIAPWIEDHLPITMEGQIQFPSSNSEMRFTVDSIYTMYSNTWTWREQLSGQVGSKKRREVKSDDNLYDDLLGSHPNNNSNNKNNNNNNNNKRSEIGW